jgi:hypothetical protein
VFCRNLLCYEDQGGGSKLLQNSDTYLQWCHKFRRPQSYIWFYISHHISLLSIERCLYFKNLSAFHAVTCLALIIPSPTLWPQHINSGFPSIFYAVGVCIPTVFNERLLSYTMYYLWEYHNDEKVELENMKCGVFMPSVCLYACMYVWMCALFARNRWMYFIRIQLIIV